MSVSMGVNISPSALRFAWPNLLLITVFSCHESSIPWPISFHSLLTVMPISGAYEAVAALPISVGLQEPQPRLFHACVPVLRYLFSSALVPGSL